MTEIKVFDQNWFKKHNNTLCWFANAPVIKYWFRWLLRIHNDIKWSDIINQITPNSFTYNAKLKEDRIELTTDFRTHEKFGKRLYYGLKPLWYILHFWDWATYMQPKLNVGFDTLTVYPGSEGTDDPVDGDVGRISVNETFSTIRAGAGNTYGTTSTSYVCASVKTSATENQFEQIRRSIFCYKTSALTSGASISSAVLSLYGVTANSIEGSSIEICASTPASTTALENADYGQLGSTSFSSIAYASLTITGYNDFTLNASGISNISKTGISKFGGRTGWDLNNDTTGLSWVSSTFYQFNCYYSNNTGTTNDPKLVVTYTLAAGPAKLKTRNGLEVAKIKTINGLEIGKSKTIDGLV